MSHEISDIVHDDGIALELRRYPTGNIRCPNQVLPWGNAGPPEHGCAQAGDERQPAAPHITAGENAQYTGDNHRAKTGEHSEALELKPEGCKRPSQK